MDLFPELEQVVDVVERIRRVAVALGQEVRGHPAEDRFARPLATGRFVAQLRRRSPQVHTLWDDDPRLLDPERFVTTRRALGSDDVGPQRGPIEQRDLTLGEGRVVGVHHGRTRPVCELVEVERE